MDYAYLLTFRRTARPDENWWWTNFDGGRYCHLLIDLDTLESDYARSLWTTHNKRNVSAESKDGIAWIRVPEGVHMNCIIERKAFKQRMARLPLWLRQKELSSWDIEKLKDFPALDALEWYSHQIEHIIRHAAHKYPSALLSLFLAGDLYSTSGRNQRLTDWIDNKWWRHD